MDELTIAGKAMICWDLGSFYKMSRASEKAIFYLGKSLEYEFSYPAAIHLACSYIDNDQVGKARAVLERITEEKLPAECLSEYYQTRGTLALLLRDKKDALRIIKRTKSLEPMFPAFDRDLSTLRENLLEYLAGVEKSDSEESRQSLIRKVLYSMRSLSRVFILQPNIFGLGLNINQLLSPEKQTPSASMKAPEQSTLKR